MSEVDVSCACGHVMRISEFAVGMPMPCARCKAPLDYKRIRPVAVAGPAPVETFAAPRDARPAPDSGDARRSAPAAAPSAVTQPAPTINPRGRTECARCGRKFRGEWDVHETSKGPLCHICANRVAEVAPQEAGDQTVEPVIGLQLPGTRMAAGVLDAPPDWKPPSTKYQFDPQSPVFRRILYALAIGTVLLTIYVFTTEDALPTPGQGAEVNINQPSPQLGRLPSALVLVVQGLCTVGGTFLTLLLALWFRNKLPMDRWWANALHVGVVGLGLGAVHTVLGIVPMVGWICSLLLFYWVLSSVYDFGFVDFVVFLAMGVPAGFIIYFVQIALLGLIVNLFT